MTKEEELGDLLYNEGVSVRTLNIAKAYELTIDQMLNMHYEDFAGLKRCGKRTAEELCAIADKLRKEKKAIDKAQEESEVFFNRFESFKDSDAAWESFCRSYLSDEQSKAVLSQYQYPSTTLNMPDSDNVSQFLEWIEQVCTVYYEEISKYTFDYAQKVFLTGDLTSDMYIAHISCIESFFTRYSALLMQRHLEDSELYLLKVFGEALIKSLLLSLDNITSYQQIIRNCICSVFKEKVAANAEILNFLNNSVIFDFESFESRFQLLYHHFPVFAYISFIINHELMNRETEIVKPRLPFDYSKYKPISMLGEEMWLTSNRVREIYEKAFRRVRLRTKHLSPRDVSVYGLGKLSYFTPQNTDFERIRKEELLDFDFYAFTALIALNLLPNMPEYAAFPILWEYPDHQECKSFTCSTALLNYFRVEGAINYLRTHYEPGSEIRLNSFLSRRHLWAAEKIPSDIFISLKGFFLYICEDAFSLRVIDAAEPYRDEYEVDGEKFLRVDDSQLKQLIADALRKGPLSPDEIYKKLKKKDSSLKDIQPSKIYDCLGDRTLFTPIGSKSLYQLASASGFTGSVNKCIDHVLDQSAELMPIDKLIAKVLELRPDSNYRSVRAVLLSKIKKGELYISETNIVSK